jgi:hypothetical protein
VDLEGCVGFEPSVIPRSDEEASDDFAIDTDLSVKQPSLAERSSQVCDSAPSFDAPVSDQAVPPMDRSVSQRSRKSYVRKIAPSEGVSEAARVPSRKVMGNTAIEPSLVPVVAAPLAREERIVPPKGVSSAQSSIEASSSAVVSPTDPIGDDPCQLFDRFKEGVTKGWLAKSDLDQFIRDHREALLEAGRI